jgi:hypothetical protein
MFEVPPMTATRGSLPALHGAPGGRLDSRPGEAAGLLLRDEGALSAWLDRNTEWPRGWMLRRVWRARAWPGRRGDLSFELKIELERPGEELCGTLQGLCGSRLAARTSRQAGQHSGELCHLALSDDVLGMSLCTPDQDPELPAVGPLLDSSRAPQILHGCVAAQRLGLDQDGALESSSIRAWRINKRCTLRLRSSGGRTVYVKVLKRMPEADLLLAQRRLRRWLLERSRGRIAVPALLDVDRQHRLVIHAAAEPFNLQMPSGEADERRAAQALALIHAAPQRVQRLHQAVDELRIIRRWQQPLRWLRPELAGPLRLMIRNLVHGGRGLIPAPPALVHRDFHTGQVLCGDRLWIVDFDTLCMGDPEVDVSTGCSHLALDVLRSGQTRTEAVRRMQAFVEHFRCFGGRTDPRRLRFYMASALLRLGAIHAVRGLPMALIHTLWTLSTEQLEGEGCVS